MNCKKCGALLTENDQFCKNCGTAKNSPLQSNVQAPINNQTEQMGQPINTAQYQSPQSNYPNNNQLNWQNSYNPNSNFQKKSNNNIIYIVIGVVVVFVVFVGVACFTAFGNKKAGSSENSSLVQNKTYKVNFGEFTFDVPDNLVYQVDGDNLLIGNEEDTWVTGLQTFQGNFAQLKARKDQLSTYMQQLGKNATEVNLKTIGGVEFITMEVTQGGQNAIAAYAKANSMYVIAIVVMTKDNDIDYSILEKVAPIIKSAKYNSQQTNLSADINIDMSKVAELAK